MRSSQDVLRVHVATGWTPVGFATFASSYAMPLVHAAASDLKANLLRRLDGSSFLVHGIPTYRKRMSVQLRSVSCRRPSHRIADAHKSGRLLQDSFRYFGRKSSIWSRRASSAGLARSMSVQRAVGSPSSLFKHAADPSTTDTCLTSLFSLSWMCRLCGREACAECYRKLSSISPSITPATAPKDRRDPEKRLIACVPRESHSHQQFFPISRFAEPELRAAVLEMSAILSDEKHTDTSRERTPATTIPELRYPAPLDAGNSLANLDLLAAVVAALPHLPDAGRPLPPPEVKSSTSSPPTPEPSAPDQGTRPPPAPKPPSASNVIPFVRVETTPRDIDVTTTSSTSEPVSSPLLPISPSTSASDLSRDTQRPKSKSPALSAKPIKSEDPIPYYPTVTFSDSTLTEEIFRNVWTDGHPLVVKGILEKFHIKWTPEYFIEKYGDHSCTIVDCVTEVKREVTVGWFFALFGKYSERVDSRVWKLKDWPSSTDFKSAFPELYDDFARAVPIPSYCRRDGVLNIASHFPSNAVAPDLGTYRHTLVMDAGADLGDN